MIAFHFHLQMKKISFANDIGCRSLLFITLNISCQFLVAFKVSFEKSADNLMGTPLLISPSSGECTENFFIIFYSRPKTRIKNTKRICQEYAETVIKHITEAINTLSDEV